MSDLDQSPIPDGDAGTVVFPTSAERRGLRCTSATTVVEEALVDGRWIRLYWSASGQVQRESAALELPGLDPLQHPLHAFELEVDGQSLRHHWDWIDCGVRDGQRPGTVEGVVELRHQIRPVAVKLVTRLDGTPILARYLEITNTADRPAALSRVVPWSGLLWNTPTTPSRQLTQNINPSFVEVAADSSRRSKFSLGYFAEQGWGQEGDFTRVELPGEVFRVERRGRGSSHGWPYFAVRNEATGETFLLGLAWSAAWFAEFDHRDESLLCFGAGPMSPPPLRLLAPGETARSAEVHLGPVHGSTEQAVAAWHHHMRASVVPPRPPGKEQLILGGRVVEEPGEWILREIDIAAEMGLEGFMVDAGWYGREFGQWTQNRGDWFVGDWMPGGMDGVRERAHDKGMLFGLWHEPETVSPGSQLYREHPDWVARADAGREVGPGTVTTLDLANPEAAAHFEESILRVIADYNPDYYKLDSNVDVGEGGQSARDGFLEGEFWRHCETLYRTFDRVRREHPGLLLENCSGGGGRNDLGMASRFHYSVESDWSVFPFSIRAINAMSLFYPPEAIGYYHNHMSHAHLTADLNTHLRVILFAVPVFVGFGAQDADRATEHFRATRRYIELHKSFCRPVLLGPAMVFHHTPEIGVFRPAPWCVLEYAHPDATSGYAGVFRLAAGAASYALRPRGVDPARTYRVTLDNRQQTFETSGRELMAGLEIRCDAALTSELVLYEAV